MILLGDVHTLCNYVFYTNFFQILTFFKSLCDDTGNLECSAVSVCKIVMVCRKFMSYDTFSLEVVTPRLENIGNKFSTLIRTFAQSVLTQRAEPAMIQFHQCSHTSIFPKIPMWNPLKLWCFYQQHQRHVCSCAPSFLRILKTVTIVTSRLIDLLQPALGFLHFSLEVQIRPCLTSFCGQIHYSWML